MHWLLLAFILGAVEGLTEFLPVSSSGHLILAGELLHFTGDKASVFQVAIQLGAILAVVALYWPRFMSLLAGLRELRHPRAALAQEGLHGLRGIGLLVLTTFPPSLVGLLLHHHIKSLFSAEAVVMALVVGALCMLLVERLAERIPPRVTSLDAITPRLALGIGCCQCLALWPGFSRSASTIMGGMLLGARRDVAAEYSFLAAVPLMFAATGYDVLSNLALFSADDIPLFAAGFFFSFVFAWLAVRTFIALLGRLTLRPFAWYRLALAVPVYWFMVR
ncbi:MAG TPA: undecaprenyl-diphosphate phosphatase [Candidatus Avidesulfovibrio excrementigallinarum]|nr:undecaprenyl-diphosphate phosphatase [Candidatus Avidesulfovibrio excrementigallinarum]